MDNSRKRILENSRSDAEQRRVALMDLHGREIEATKVFVDGMAQAIEALYQAPGIIQEGIKARISKIKMDVGLEIGGMRGEDFLRENQKQVAALESRLSGYYSAQGNAEIHLGQLREELAKRTQDMLGNLDKETKKAFDARGIIKETKNGIEFQKEATSNYYKEVAYNNNVLKNDIEAIRDSLSPKSFQRMAGEMSLANLEIDKYTEML